MYSRCRREVHIALTKSSCCYLYDTTARQMCGFFHFYSVLSFFAFALYRLFHIIFGVRFVMLHLIRLRSALLKLIKICGVSLLHSFYLGGILWGHLNQSFSRFASTDVQHHPHRGSFDSAHLANFVFVSRDTFFPVAIIRICLSYAPF